MKGFIYKIVVDDCTYIGSTRSVRKRAYSHNCLFKKGYENKLYNYCQIKNVKKIKLQILESAEVDDRLELRKKEQHYINQIDSYKLLNKNKAYITDADRKLYKQTITCDSCGSRVRRDVIARHRSSNKCKKKSIVII